MTAITILPETPGKADTQYRARAGKHEAVGKTAGQALDSLTSQLTDQPSTLVVQLQRPDAWFGTAQRERLQLLMARWRDARDRGALLAPTENEELETLVAAELKAAGDRATGAGREPAP